jgi:hypothetical protein
VPGSRRGRRLWLRVDVQGHRIPVYVVKVVDEEGSEGEYDSEAPAILIRQVDNVAAMKQTLHHELLHVCFRGHSGTTREGLFRSKTPEGRHAREEAIISFLEPIQFDLLVRNGWLRYPNPPRVK